MPQNQLAPYVQDALDEIQYATGSVDTPWGRKRAEDGHPAPFHVGYVEVGNEDFLDGSGSYNAYRFPMFYDAIKAAYPDMKIVATTNVTSRTPDVVDEHYYQSPSWMNTHANLYDSRSRSGPKVMVGEWASQEGTPTPDLNAALGDASWLTGLERNSDLVTQEAYAPMLVNVHNVAWRTNLIGFDALSSYGSPSYWAQQMLASNHGDQVISAGYAGVGGLNVVATRDSRTGRIYLTIVNPGVERPTGVGRHRRRARAEGGPDDGADVSESERHQHHRPAGQRGAQDHHRHLPRQRFHADRAGVFGDRPDTGLIRARCSRPASTEVPRIPSGTAPRGSRAPHSR